MSRFLIPILLAMSLSLASSPLQAQSVLVRVVDAETGTPIQGAFVTLLDSDGNRQTSALTNDNGRFLFNGVPRGTFSIRAEMIGRESVESAAFQVVGDSPPELVIELPYRPFEMEELRVESERRCVVRPEEGVQTAFVWEEARKALEVAAWGLEKELFRYRLVRRVRELHPERGTVLTENSEHFAGHFREPFTSRSPEDLMANGFVQAIGGDTLAFAPGAAVLLSSAFLDTHCLRLEEDSPEGTIGVAFEPVDDREVSDIEGVVWLDESTWRLESVEFTYTRFPGVLEGLGLGGEVQFHQLPSGAWIVRNWHVRMPIRQYIVDRTGGGYREGFKIVSIWEESGEVLTVSDQRGNVITASGRASLAGTVFDSIRGMPLGGARVVIEGTSYEARADSVGRFRIDDLPEGRYSIFFSHPWMASMSVSPEAREVELRTGRETRADLIVTAALLPQLSARTIPRDLPAATSGVSGSVVDADSGEPLSEVLVSLGGSELVQLTNEEGRFMFPAVDPGAHLLKTELLGRATVEDSLHLDADKILIVTVRMPFEALPVEGLLVEVEARDLKLEIAGFYTRQLETSGLFISRERIDEEGPLYTSDLLRTLPGVRVVTGLGMGTQNAVVLTGLRTFFGHEFDVPCYPAVWIDGQMVHQGTAGPLRQGPAWLDQLIHPDAIAGIEIYNSAASMPVQYNLYGECGVIVIWTR